MSLKGLKDRVVIVTGGASGIGRATAARLVQEGAQVALVDIDGAAASAVGPGARLRRAAARRRRLLRGRRPELLRGRGRALRTRRLPAQQRRDRGAPRPAGGLRDGRVRAPRPRQLLRDLLQPARDAPRRAPGRNARHHRQHVLGHRAARRAPARRVRLHQGRHHRSDAGGGDRERRPAACGSMRSPLVRSTPLSSTASTARFATGRVELLPRGGSAPPRRSPPWSPSCSQTRRRSSPAPCSPSTEAGHDTAHPIRDDPADLGVLEAPALLRNRALSSAELTEACLGRI